MKIIRIEEIGCSSCLIMKSRMLDLSKDRTIDWVSLEYEDAKEILEKYKIKEEILPIYIREDKRTFLIGEKSKKEILEFLKEN